MLVVTRNFLFGLVERLLCFRKNFLGSTGKTLMSTLNNCQHFLSTDAQVLTKAPQRLLAGDPLDHVKQLTTARGGLSQVPARHRDHPSRRSSTSFTWLGLQVILPPVVVTPAASKAAPISRKLAPFAAIGARIPRRPSHAWARFCSVPYPHLTHDWLAQLCQPCAASQGI